jgi:hypothetical protein
MARGRLRAIDAMIEKLMVANSADQSQAAS